MEQELTHHGIKGMHWGVRRFQQADGTLTSAGKKRYSADRKTKLTESVEAKKAHVENMRKQAGERIQFYGGKNTALIAIQKGPLLSRPPPPSPSPLSVSLRSRSPPGRRL